MIEMALFGDRGYSSWNFLKSNIAAIKIDIQASPIGLDGTNNHLLYSKLVVLSLNCRACQVQARRSFAGIPR